MYDLQGRELATFLQRFSAYLLDSLFSTVPLVVFLVFLAFLCSSVSGMRMYAILAETMVSSMQCSP